MVEKTFSLCEMLIGSEGVRIANKNSKKYLSILSLLKALNFGDHLVKINS